MIALCWRKFQIQLLTYDRKRVITLHLAETQIADLAPLAKFNLHALNLAGTKVTSLTGIGRFGWWSKPGELNLSGCAIAELDKPSMEQIEAVKILRLDCRHLKDLTPLGSLTRVTTLHLENADPAHAFGWISKLKTLQALHLLGAPIDSDTHSQMFASFAEAPNLCALYLPAGSDADANRFPVLRDNGCLC